MNLIKVFFRQTKRSIQDFKKQKKGFFISWIILMWLFVLLIWIIFFNFFNYMIVYLPWGYIFAPKMLWLVMMIVFYFIVFLSSIATIPTFLKNKEINLLRTLPISNETIIKYNIVKLIYFSLYGSLFVLIPILIAFGIANWYNIFYFIFLPLIILLFTIIATLLWILVFWLFDILILSLPKTLKKLTIFILALIIAGKTALLFPKLEIKDKTWFSILETYIFTFDINQLLFPYNWFTKLLIYIGESNIIPTLVYLFFVTVTAYLLYQLLTKLATKTFEKSIENITSFWWNIAVLRKKWFNMFTKNKYINLFIKDLLVHIKDPIQRTQLLVFAILAIIYIIIIKWLSIKKILDPNIVTILSILWIWLVGFFISWFTLRFVFPNISLEGRAFWILKLAPLNIKKLYIIKFIFFFLFSLLFALALLISYHKIIWILPEISLLNTILGLTLVAFITALFFSLGSIYPNFNETNPSKIATSMWGLLWIFISNGLTFVIMAILWTILNPYYKTKILCKDYNHLSLIIIYGILTSLLLIGTIIILSIWYKKFKKLEF